MQYVNFDENMYSEINKSKNINISLENLIEDLMLIERMFTKNSEISYLKGVIEKFVFNLIREIQYLFKNNEYKDEEEIRLISLSQSPKIDYGVDGVPKVYLEIDREIEIEEVCLGSKVENCEMVATWIYSEEKNIKISKSACNYR